MARNGSSLVLPGFLFCASTLTAQDYLVLETHEGKTSTHGKTALEHREASMASTFKVVLAWAGIEAGLVNSESLRTVKDKHVPGSPRAVTLKQAMFFSSNDYFDAFDQEIGHDKLTSFVQKSGLFTRKVGKNWIGTDPTMLVRGGVMKTTPALNHAFMNNVASGKLIRNREVQAELEKSMFWPSPDPKIQLFGKTGTVTGAVWFNGFGKTPQGTKVVTVFIPGGIQDRPKTIRLFYEAFGLKWDEKMVQQIE